LGLSRIAIHLDLDKKLPTITGDPEKLRQVFVNLINNAHHAMQEMNGGDLFLRSRRQAGKVLIEVRDTGHGVPEKDLARIFDPFFTTKPVGQGTGLGLSVSYGIIHDHGGTIEVESPVRDAEMGILAGTVFRIALPANAGDEQQTADQASFGA
jgi:signal transduction histidine kinase